MKKDFMNKTYSGIGVVLMSSLLLMACGGGKDAKKKGGQDPNAPVPVNLYEVHLGRALFYDKYPGNVVALSQVDIRPEVEGYITGIFFKEGDHVKKGQKLYEIDQSKYQASYAQAMAEVRVQQANLDQAQKDADRYIYLNKHDAIAKQTLDHAMTTLQNAKNQVADAKQALIKAQTDLNYSIIRAPFDGTIGLSQVKLGNTVTVGQTVLNTISTDDPMAVDFVINEQQLPRFIKLQRQGYNPDDSLFTMLMPDNSLYDHTGKISVIDRGVDPQSGTTTIRLVFPNPDFMLRAGMSCTVRVHNEDTAQQIVIPSRAIVEQMGEYFVYVAKDSSVVDSAASKKGDVKKNMLVAAQRKVVLGQTIDADVIVKTGIKDSDKVIVDGVQKVRDGGPITTQNTQGPQAGQGGKGKK